MATVEMPDRVWAKLVKVADARGVKVSDLLVATITELINPLDVERRIVRAVEDGLTDALIAERVALPKPIVARLRRKAGLAPNRPRSLAMGA